MAGGRQSAPLGVDYGYRVYVFVVYAQRISKRRQVTVTASVEGSGMGEKLKYCFKVSTKERKEAGYGVKSPSSGVRDHGQNPNSLPFFPCCASNRQAVLLLSLAQR